MLSRFPRTLRQFKDTEERDYSNLMWSSMIRTPQHRNFNEEVGMSRNGKQQQFS